MAKKIKIKFSTKVENKRGEPIRMEGGDAGFISESILIAVEKKKKERKDEKSKAN